jgi:hypothetical protein
MSDPGSVQITLPRWAGIAIAAFALGMIGLLATQIVLLEDQRRTVRTQRAIAQRQIRQALPVLKAVRPLVRDARAARPFLRQAGGRLDRLTRNATPLVTDLRVARAGDAVRAAITVANDLLDADVGRATASVARIAAATDQLSPALRELRDRGLLGRAAVVADTVPKLDGTLRESLRVQRQTLAILQQSLAIQRRTEQHAASLDRKTGGKSPPPTPVPAPLP